MSVKREFNVANVVIVANRFNPSVFSSHWLQKNNFYSEGEILPQSIFSENLVNIASQKCSLLVLEQKLEFAWVDSDNSAFRSKLIPILKELPEIQYSAIGINFVWFLSDEGKESSFSSGRNQFWTDSEVYSHFDFDDARFGAYLSRDFGGGRLRLDIKPVKVQDTTTNEELDGLQYSFNFHKELVGEEISKELLEHLDKLDEFFAKSKLIVESIK